MGVPQPFPFSIKRGEIAALNVSAWPRHLTRNDILFGALNANEVSMSKGDAKQTKLMLTTSFIAPGGVLHSRMYDTSDCGVNNTPQS